MINRSKKSLFVVVAIVVVDVAIGAYLLLRPSEKNPADQPGFAQVEGNVTCLPHKDTSGPQTLECAFGLKTDDGKNYGLKNLPQQYMDTNQRLSIGGMLEQPTANELYDVVGTISVQSVEQK